MDDKTPQINIEQQNEVYRELVAARRRVKGWRTTTISWFVTGLFLIAAYGGTHLWVEAEESRNPASPAALLAIFILPCLVVGIVLLLVSLCCLFVWLGGRKKLNEKEQAFQALQ